MFRALPRGGPTPAIISCYPPPMSEESLKSVFREAAPRQKRGWKIARRTPKNPESSGAVSHQAPTTRPSPERVARRPSKARDRSERKRVRIFSPVRVIFLLASMPVIAASVALSLYVRTSPYSPQNAMLHLVAMSGCNGAKAVGLAPATKGRVGYHERNDPDGNGVACEPEDAVAEAALAGPMILSNGEQRDSDARIVGGARFIKP